MRCQSCENAAAVLYDCAENQLDNGVSAAGREQVSCLR